MPSGIAVLHRVRTQMKRRAELAYAQAERERADREAVVDAMTERLVTTTTTSADILDHDLLAAWRVRARNELQQQARRLERATTQADVRQGELLRATRSAEVTEELVESRRLQDAQAAARQGARHNDERATQQWIRRSA